MYHALIALINLLPRPLVLCVASFVGRLLYALAQRTRFRGSLERNIRNAFPDRFSDAEISRIARKHASDLVKTAVEVARFRELPRLLEKGTIQVEGIEFFERALAQGSGAVILSAHMGNWELLIALLGLLGYRAHAVVLRQTGERFNRWLEGERERFGTKVLYAGETTSETIERILNENGVVLLLADHHNYGGDARNIVAFFGKPVSVPAGPVVYPMRTGAALIPAFSIRHSDGTHRVMFEPPLEFDGTGDPGRDFAAHCRRYIEVFERWITRYPDQWMWSHERWNWLDDNLKPKHQ